MPLPSPILVTTPSSTSTSQAQQVSLSSSALPHTSLPIPQSELTPTSSTSGIPYTTVRRGNPTPTFSEDRENYHRVEFEAPLSADVVSPNHHHHQQREGLGPTQFNRFSIDLSLELERELENMESPPVSPGYPGVDAKHNDNANANAVREGLEVISLEDDSGRGGTAMLPKRGDSLHTRLASEPTPDPEILAHIITQLRHALADMTKERDDLVKMMAETNQRDAETQDALQVMTDKATSAEEEMMEMRRKMKEDEDQIVLLRTKVEESRRGLMRLQTENRRQSMAPIDVARASGALAGFATPNSAKRTSFVPLTGSGQIRGNGHKRGTSVSDSGLGAFPTPDLTPSPNAHAFNIANTEAILSGNSSASSRRFSGLFGRQSPPHGGHDGIHSAGVLPSGLPDSTVAAAAAVTAAAAANTAEIENLRKELQTTKDELETAKHDLVEANEAKEASETCVKALREFIADNNVGASMAGTGGAIKLPPPPMMATGLEEPLDTKKTGTGWGFKLWGNGNSTATTSETPSRPSVVASGPYSATVAGMGGQSPVLTQPPATAVPIGAAPLSRKLGGFFSSRSTSVSSSHSRSEQNPQQQNLLTQNLKTSTTTSLPQLQTNAAAMMMRTPSQRESMYSYSDTSSVAEPVSPGSDINGLGSAGYQYQFKSNGVPIERVGVVAEEDSKSLLEEMEGKAGEHHVSVSMSSVDLDGLR